MASIPKAQTAAWLEKPEPGARFQIRNDIEVPSPGDGQVLIKLEYTGFCHSDVHSAYGETPMSTDVAGHEGVGFVVRDGSTVHAASARSVMLIRRLAQTKSILDVIQGALSSVSYGQIAHPKGFHVTEKEYIVAPAKHVTRIPGDLKAEIAAPLLCAGLTLYSAIAKARLRPGNWLVIPGAGGGLGHIGVQIAAKRGYKVIAIDSGDSKREMCLKLGATAFLDFKKDAVEDEVKRLTNGLGAHATIVTAGTDGAYEQAVKLIRNCGTLVCVGLPRSGAPLPISPFLMVVRSLTIVGSSVGTDAEMQELLEMAVKGDVVPEISIHGFNEINDILEKLARFEIGGRVVLKLPQ